MQKFSHYRHIIKCRTFSCYVRSVEKILQSSCSSDNNEHILFSFFAIFLFFIGSFVHSWFYLCRVLRFTFLLGCIIHSWILQCRARGTCFIVVMSCEYFVILGAFFIFRAIFIVSTSTLFGVINVPLCPQKF